MTILEQMLEGTGSVAILGHIRPDGDCLGSALGLYNYLRLNCPDIRAVKAEIVIQSQCGTQTVPIRANVSKNRYRTRTL